MSEPIRLELVTPPSSEPVSAAQLQDHSRTYDDSESIYLGQLITAAREWVENVTGLQLMTTTYRLYLDNFASPMRLPRPPLQSVSSIKYLDQDGQEQTLTSTIYQVDKVSEPGLIYLAYNQSWPNYRVVPNGIKIEFVAGYSNLNLVPKKFLSAILLLAGHLYENREPAGEVKMEKIPFTLESLLWTRRAKVMV